MAQSVTKYLCFEQIFIHCVEYIFTIVFVSLIDQYDRPNIMACETESEVDFLLESFVLTDEQEAVLQHRIIIWRNAMADDIEQGNDFDDLMTSRTDNVQQENVFDDLVANWTKEQRSRFIADWTMSQRLRINAREMMTISP